jgi:hypothetical protein
LEDADVAVYLEHNELTVTTVDDAEHSNRAGAVTTSLDAALGATTGAAVCERRGYGVAAAGETMRRDACTRAAALREARRSAAGHAVARRAASSEPPGDAAVPGIATRVMARGDLLTRGTVAALDDLGNSGMAALVAQRGSRGDAPTGIGGSATDHPQERQDQHMKGEVSH